MGNRCDRAHEGGCPATVVANSAPILHPGQDMFDAGAALAMAAPRSITNDAVVREPWGAKRGDAPVAAVREHSTMFETKRFDRGFPVVNRIVAVARSATGDGDDTSVAVASEYLDVARVAIVLRAPRDAVIACRDQRAVDDPCVSTIEQRRWPEQSRQSWPPVQL